ncbi:MAG: hypothetical protein JSS72_03865 [Armatimonadetes bacterium]|nr:hypothetical protein [Armatimonadota bacterium]
MHSSLGDLKERPSEPMNAKAIWKRFLVATVIDGLAFAALMPAATGASQEDQARVLVFLLGITALLIYWLAKAHRAFGVVFGITLSGLGLFVISVPDAALYFGICACLVGIALTVWSGLTRKQTSRRQPPTPE